MSVSTSIFCPNEHLILEAARCPECGWARPAPAELGRPLWGPLQLPEGVGGPAPGAYALPAAGEGVLVLPLHSGKLARLSLADGALLGLVALPEGLYARQLVAYHDQIYAALSDERTLEQAGPGYLARLESRTGQLSNLWQPGPAQLSAPAGLGGRLVLRTGGSRLVALDLEGESPDDLQPRWQQALQSWWPQAPVIAGGPLRSAGSQPDPAEALVLLPDGQAMQGQGWLCAFGLADGAPRWQAPTQGLLSQPPLSLEGRILYVQATGRRLRSLTCLDPQGAQLWRQNYPRIYSHLAGGGGLVYLVVRGPAPSGELGHYRLVALELNDGQAAWQVDLPQRAALLHYLEDGTVVVGDEGGVLRAYAAADGMPRWEHPLGSAEDRLQSHFLLADGLLLAGTCRGRVVAIQALPAPAAVADPEAALQQGDPAGAAEAYARQGAYRRAAELYAGQLGQPRRAAQLYLAVGDTAQAAALLRRAGELEPALELARKAGDASLQGELLAEQGDHLQAARCYTEAGELEAAARQYEAGGDLRRALELYWRLGLEAEHDRLRPQVDYNLSDVEELERRGELPAAGEAALKIGAWRKAVDLFRQAVLPQRELEALQALAEAEGEAWAWGDLAEIARRLGRFPEEAAAWLVLERPLKAGQAFQRAARQLEQRSPGESEQIAAFYEQAMHGYEAGGDEEGLLQCRARLVALRELPWVIVEGAAEKAFREDEINRFKLFVRNVGAGIAEGVTISVGKDLFTPVGSVRELQGMRLAPGSQRTVNLYLRPLPDSVGEAVPLEIEWAWQDRHQRGYADCISAPVRVKRRQDSTTGGAPPQVNYFQGTVIQAEDGHVEIVGGDKIGGDRIAGDRVQGDRFEGDKIAGDQVGGDLLSGAAQKGDRVEVRRGSGGRPAESPESAQLCPNCSLPYELDQAFCQACGYEFKNGDTDAA